MKKNKTLILGSDGYLGNPLMHHLENKGHFVERGGGCYRSAGRDKAGPRHNRPAFPRAREGNRREANEPRSRGTGPRPRNRRARRPTVQR